jgi:hypothetical protein
MAASRMKLASQSDGLGFCGVIEEEHLWPHEIAPGLAIRWPPPPPTMLATDAEW